MRHAPGEGARGARISKNGSILLGLINAPPCTTAPLRQKSVSLREDPGSKGTT